MVLTSILYLVIGCLFWVWYALNSALLNNYKIESLMKYPIIGTVFLFGFILESISYICKHLTITIY